MLEFVALVHGHPLLDHISAHFFCFKKDNACEVQIRELVGVINRHEAIFKRSAALPAVLPFEFPTDWSLFLRGYDVNGYETTNNDRFNPLCLQIVDDRLGLLNFQMEPAI